MYRYKKAELARPNNIEPIASIEVDKELLKRINNTSRAPVIIESTAIRLFLSIFKKAF
jgi:hypothetical protein